MNSGMQVLIRRHEGGLYLQPSGNWVKNRETARQFESSGFACLWAFEQKLENVDVLLAFTNPV